MAMPTLHWKMLPNTILLLLTMLPLLRHTYVTATSYNNSDDAVRLLNDVILSFDHRVRPVLNQSQPIQVHVTYNLVNLIEIDEINQRISLNIWANFSWWDEVRTWNPNDYGGNHVAHPSPEDIWRPKTVVTNTADERDLFKDVDSPMSIYSTGASRWYAGAVHSIVCGMDLTYFPFDVQTCTVSVMATNLGQEIEFVPVYSEIQASDYTPNGEWELKSSGLTPASFPASTEEILPFLLVSITFQRRPMFYIVSIMIPIMCLSFLSLFGFVIPKDSGERASFAITVLLALAVYMGTVSGLLPANSDTFPILSSYIFCLLCLSMLSVIIIVCQMRMTSGGSCSSSSSSSGSNDDINNDNENDNDPNRRQDIDKIDSNKKLRNETDLNNFLKSFQHGNMGQTNRVVPFDNSIKDSKNNHGGLTNADADAYKNKAGLKILWRATSNAPNTSSNVVSLERMKKLILEYDDTILFVIFSVLWVIFSIVFVSQIVSHS